MVSLEGERRSTVEVKLKRNERSLKHFLSFVQKMLFLDVLQ